MSDSDDENDQAVVDDLVEDAVVANPHSVHMRLADEANCPGRAGLLGEEVDGSADALLLTSRKGGQDPESSPRDLDAIDRHRKPRSAFTSSQGT